MSQQPWSSSFTFMTMVIYVYTVTPSCHNRSGHPAWYCSCCLRTAQQHCVLPSPTPHAVTRPAHAHLLLPSTLPLSHTEPDWGYAADHR